MTWIMLSCWHLERVELEIFAKTYQNANVVKYAPSACNTQPWRKICFNNYLKVYRNTLIKCFFPANKLPYYNSIDMGIFLCFLEITLGHNGYEFDRVLSLSEDSDSKLIEIATYTIKKNL